MTLTYDPVGASKFAAELRELQEDNAADDIGISARALELAQLRTSPKRATMKVS